ncbi:MAG: GDSL-type esterase/lipase family protein [Campylobacteraceae bacterium]|jgi:lysophospholipase L1-like esterase|nr:GDSL-type esterase/lipase family protein [Campylobacteraceae bacterium]
MKRLIALIAVIFTAVFVFLKSDGKIEIPQDAVILAFGDSLTKGYGAEENESYPTHLGKILNINVINAGVNGENSYKGVERLPQLLEEIKPRIVIFCHGGNDILRKYDLQNTKQNLTSMITLMQSKNIEIIFIGVPSLEGLFIGTNDIYGELADEFGLIYDDDTLERIIKTPSLKSDQIHPNAAGYALLAQNISEIFNKHFKITSR